MEPRVGQAPPEAAARSDLGPRAHWSFAGLSKPALISFVLLSVATGTGLLANGLMARLLGVESFGLYSYAIAILGLLSVPYSVGLSQVVMRSFAAYRARGQHDLMCGLDLWGRRWVLGSAVVIASIAALAVWVIEGRTLSDKVLTLWAAFAVLPGMAVLTFSVATLQGLGRVIRGQIPDQVIRPVLLLLLVLAGWLAFERGDVASWQAMLALFASVSIAGLVAVITVGATLPLEARKAGPQFTLATWARAILPFLAIGSLTQINAQIDILMLGWLAGMEDVGLYRPAILMANLITFGQAAVSVPMRPIIASLRAAGDHARLQNSVTAGARLAVLFSLPVALGLAIFGYWPLSVLFGEDFTQAWGVLAILCAGKFVNTTTGPGLITLNMTGNESFTLRGVAIAALTNLLLCATLIPAWGIYGAAAATCISEVMLNTLLAYGVYRRVGIVPIAVRLNRPPA